MLLNKYFIFGVFLSFPIWLSTISVNSEELPKLPKLAVYTVEVPPFVMRNEASELMGKSVDKTIKFLKNKGVKFDITLAQWSAAYARILTRPNTLIFPIARTPDREDKFYWLHPLNNDLYYLYSKKGNNLDQLTKEEILKGHYKVSCIETTVQCEFARKFGFPENRIVKSPELNSPVRYRLLIKDRVDFTVFNDAIFNIQAKNNTLDSENISKSLLVGKSMAYLAINKNSDPQILAILQKNNN